MYPPGPSRGEPRAVFEGGVVAMPCEGVEEEEVGGAVKHSGSSRPRAVLHSFSRCLRSFLEKRGRKRDL